MTDRELMQMALDALESCGEDENHDGETFQYYDYRKVGTVKKALSERLERPDEWAEITSEEGAEIWADCHDIDWKRTVPPKEIVKRISEKLKEKNT